MFDDEDGDEVDDDHDGDDDYDDVSYDDDEDTTADDDDVDFKRKTLNYVNKHLNSHQNP